MWRRWWLPGHGIQKIRMRMQNEECGRPSARALPFSHPPNPRKQRIADLAPAGWIAPGAGQVGGKSVDRTRSPLLEVTLGSRPRVEERQQLAEGPLGAHHEWRHGDLVERKRERGVPVVDVLDPFRPEPLQNLLLKAMHDRTDGVRDVARPVRKQRHDGAALSDAPDLSIEPIQLEPMGGRAGRTDG